MTRGMLMLATVALVGTTAASSAQIRVDMNHLTCGNWLGYNITERDFVRFWMIGYYNAAANGSVLDYDRLKANSTRVAEYCKKHRADTLPTAIQKSAR